MKKVISQQSQAIQERFFNALELQINSGALSGLRGFCNKHGLNRTKYSRIKHGTVASGTQYKCIDLDALSAICNDFNVSPEWLLLGTGSMYRTI